MYMFIYLFSQCELKNFYFIQWFIISCYFIYFDASTSSSWPVGVTSSWLLCSPIFTEHFPTVWHNKVFCPFPPCPFPGQPWNKPLLPEALVKEPGFLGVFGNQDLDTKCAHGHYSVIVPKPFEWTELENICKTTSHTHAYHMYIYIYFHIYLSILKTMRSHCFLYTTVQHYRVYSSNGCQIKLRMLSSI